MPKHRNSITILADVKVELDRFRAILLMEGKDQYFAEANAISENVMILLKKMHNLKKSILQNTILQNTILQNTIPKQSQTFDENPQNPPEDELSAFLSTRE